MISNSGACVVAFFLVVLTSAQRIVNYGTCTNPNGELASCVNLEQCAYLFNMLKKTPLVSEDIMFLRRSQCGTDNNKILVCCPQRYISWRALLPEPGACGNIISNRIYGGNITKLDEFPWMALIEYNKGGNVLGHHCGGSLINDRYVLTAAHCIISGRSTWTPVRVRLGEWDTSTDPDCDEDVRGIKYCADPHIDIEIEKIITHENFIPSATNQFNDIALLRLARRVTYSQFIQPICLPMKDYLKSDTLDGIVMDVAGWGRTEENARSNLKLKAEVAVINLASCQQMYSRRNVILKSSQLCAGGERGIDACHGDSGGPLIGVDSLDKERVYIFIAGVISFGPTRCGLQGWPGVYTKVSDYIDWIKDNIEP